MMSHQICHHIKELILLQAVYTALREAEHRSTAFLPYWNLPGASWVVPRQRRCREAMVTINRTLDGLIAKCQQLVTHHPHPPAVPIEDKNQIQRALEV